MNSTQYEQDPPNRSEYSLSVEQASDIFGAAGTPRSPRTVIRYCSQGHLDCIKVDTEQNEKYLIRPESVDRRIQELQQIVKSSHVSTQRDESRHDESRPDAGDDTAPEASSSRRAELEKKIEALNAQILDLTITNRAKDHFLEQLKSERGALLDQVTQQSKRLGELETRLELGAGSPPPNLPAGTPSDTEAPPGHGSPTDDQTP